MSHRIHTQDVIVIRYTGEAPEKATDGSAGFDLRACNEEPVVLHPMKRVMMKIPLAMQLDHHLAAFVVPRSGLALKYGITVLNAPGLIDADFRGEIGVILANLGDEPFEIKKGDRIAQLKIVHNIAPKIVWEKVESLSQTARGEGGFGSTGK